MLQSTRMMEEPPMAIMQTASEVGRSLWQLASSVLRRERAFLAFELKKAFEICTCMRELDTVKYQIPASQIWTSLQPDRLRMAESSQWLYSYTSTPANLPPDLGIQVHLRSGNDATTSWLRLISTSDCFIFHIRHMQSV